MTESPKATAHPGAYVRTAVIPPGMSVTEAAKRLGVGRPALSNLLNGKSSLSPRMAVRLEKTFGADRKRLLEMQASYDRKKSSADDRDVAVRAFVPNFLTIKATQIENWADGQIEARSRLPVLLRKLVHSTGSELRLVDFPGHDDAQRKGVDGLVEAGAATPWIPEGTSYWEFGTSQNPKAKADHDYMARLTSVDTFERSRSTFVFVTPRKWSGKTAWEKGKRNAGDWKAVRALDASDLEQWLEQSIPAQIWLAEELGLPVGGYQTLEQSWRRWATASNPPLTPEIFAPSISAHGATLKDWLTRPSEQAFVIAADSRDEAVAFLACLFDRDDLRPYRDRAAVFTSPATLRKLVESSVPFIPIVHSEEVERELVNTHQRLHCIVFRPRNAVDTEPDIALDLLGHDTFETALRAMGVHEGEVDRLARESGRSPTILRRRLSNNAAIRTPAWAGDDDVARSLVPMVLIGSWHAEPKADQKIISGVANRTYEAVEADLASLLKYDDSPVWSAGRYRGVVSKIDALFAVARIITPADLYRFFDAAESVLSETDPALELPEKDRWAAVLHGKERNHSGALRNGVCETLVILSVHGNSLFQKRLGIDIDARVAALIRKLLTPMSLEKLLSQEKNLPLYAEAAPGEFLEIIEDDLRRENPVVFGLMKPAESGIFGGPSRTSLLWALECLAWRPQDLPRVAQILASLSRPEIDDNWINKPEASLRAIFRSWMPQTAASVEQRFKVLRLLAKRFPDVAWQLCIDQVKPGIRTGSFSYRPRWRSDASGAGQVVATAESYEFNRQALDLLIGWPTHDEKTLGDLVESLQAIPEEEQAKVWDLIDKWSGKAGDAAKANLRERIRRFALLRRGRRLGGGIRDRARNMYDKLRPEDPATRHGWLFASPWVEESADELEDEDLDLGKRERRIDSLRLQAMAEIWTSRAFSGIRELLAHGNAAGIVGRYVASCTTTDEQRADFVQSCLALSGGLRSKAMGCLQGFLAEIEDGSRTRVLRDVAEGLAPEELTRLFVCAPFQTSTWRLLDGYGENISTRYWKEVFPSWRRHTPGELTELIDRLLDAQRPRAAFHAVHMDFDQVETSRLKQLLRDVATVDAEPPDWFSLDRYYVSEALISLAGRAGVTQEEMAQLEFLFIDALDGSQHGIPNLEGQIVESPALFVQVVALVYKRGDEGDDPPELRIEKPDHREAVGMAAYRLLEQLKRIPGADKTGRIDATALLAWVKAVRSLCDEHARADVGDQCIGRLLAKAPEGENGIWPCEAVCEAMEATPSPEIGSGFRQGVRNARGLHWRGDGGEQERELAAKYRTWAERLTFDFPYVASLLEDIAKSYDREADWHDSEAKIRKRLPH